MLQSQKRSGKFKIFNTPIEWNIMSNFAPIVQHDFVRYFLEKWYNVKNFQTWARVTILYDALRVCSTW